MLGDSEVVTSKMEKELKYIGNCVKESQRLIPVITGFSRGAAEDTELGGKALSRVVRKKEIHHYAIGGEEERWGAEGGVERVTGSLGEKQ